MAKTFRVTRGVRLSNAVIAGLLRLGAPLGPMRLLTAPGRKTGMPRTTPVAVVTCDGGRYLTSSYGEVDWVRNLRASGGGTLRRGRRTEPFVAVELAAEEAAPVLKATLAKAPAFLRAYYAVAPAAPVEAFVVEAARHPVFRLQPPTAGQSRFTP